MFIRRFVPRISALALIALGSLVACSSGDGAPPAAEEVEADQVEVVRGVPDRGEDPAVVAIDIGEKELCTGALISPDVVLTARHCVAHTAEAVTCPPTGPQSGAIRPAESLKILVGDTIEKAAVRTRGREVIVPEGDALCNADIALIVLETPIEDIEPLEVSDHGIAKGEHVRAVGFGRESDGAPAGMKLLREHVRVLDTSDAEFLVGEATCQGDSGGPALDPETGEIVGVVSRGGPTCDGKDAHNVYTRTDAFLSLIDDTIGERSPVPADEVDAGSHGSGHGGAHGGAHSSHGGAHSGSRADAGAHHKRKDAGKGRKPKTDLGATCHKGGDCAAGSCVTEHGKQYCSRACDPHDRCPAHFTCSKTQRGSGAVCIEK